MKKLLLIGFAVLLFAGASFGQLSDDSTLSVNVVNESWISVTNDPTLLTTTINTNFTAYQGTTNIMYKMRTTFGTGTGTITVLVAPWVGAAGHTGPTLANLRFSSNDPAPGATSVGSTVVSGAAQNIFTYGANFHSIDAPGNPAAVAWTLENLPHYQTDTYTALATFTVSTT